MAPGHGKMLLDEAVGTGGRRGSLWAGRGKPPVLPGMPPSGQPGEHPAGSGCFAPGKGEADKCYAGFWEQGCLVAVLDRVRGYPRAGELWIGFFMVDKSWQAQGLGTELIQAACRRWAAGGWRHIGLACAAGNRQGLRFWQKTAFSPRGKKSKKKGTGRWCCAKSCRAGDRKGAGQLESFFTCPICGQKMEVDGGASRCPQGHSFDRARSGYWNLLPPGGKHSRQPGDSKEMVRARWEFLQQGHYEPLARAAARKMMEQLPRGGTVLDAGCGEGYYDQALWQLALEQGKPLELAGMDISKFAVDRAARRLPQASWCVGSLYHMPVAAGRCQGVMNLFAPHSPAEFGRVLQSNGVLVVAAPGKNHLWELKARLYDCPYPNPEQLPEMPGFALEGREGLTYQMELDGGQLWSLFQMTPYAHKTPEEGKARLRDTPGLRVTADFLLWTYRKQH